ncbi:MAG: lon2, partial [Sporomusa sp.]|nr:lon2 [Sporomusa sp.]
GVVNGLAVYGANIGMLMELEVTAAPNSYGTGKFTVTGVVDEEEIASPGRTVRRKSMAKGSLDNVLTVLAKEFNIEYPKYDIHVNFPGGVPVDGPSAGVTVATAIYSAIYNIPIDNTVAMTGEISIRGLVKPVGGVSAKVAAAKQAGARRVIIPKENWQELYKDMDIEVIPVETLQEALKHAMIKTGEVLRQDVSAAMPDLLAAAGIEKV